MKTRFIILLLALTAVSIDVASHPFYDSKCMVIGLTSTDDVFAEYGLGGKSFLNDIADKKLPYTMKGNRIMPEETRQDLLNRNIGKQVLDFLFQRKNGKLSDDLLRERAWTNVQLTDVERAQYAVYSPELILKEDIVPILENNYILIVENIYKETKNGKKLKKRSWIVFQVDLTEKTLEQVYAAWDNIQQYDRINVDIKYVASGVCKPYDLLAQISERAPALAVRGQVISTDPYKCAIEVTDKHYLMAERFVVYTQKETSKGKQKSVPVSKARVYKDEGKDLNLVTVAGRRKGDPKKGDIAVCSPTSPVAVSAMYQYQSYANTIRVEVGKKVDYGKINFVIDFDFRAGRLIEHKTAVYAVGDNLEHLLRSPQYFSLGTGASYNFRLLKGLTVGPYFRIMGDVWFSEYMDGYAPKSEKTGKDTKGDLALCLRFPLGVKATLNFSYPLHIVGGVEWGPQLLRAGFISDVLESRGWKSGELALFIGFNYAF